MKGIQAFSLAVTLLAVPMSSFAAASSDQAREANARSGAGATVEGTPATTPTSPRMSSPSAAPPNGMKNSPSRVYSRSVPL
jgi:hypothetical protein